MMFKHINQVYTNFVHRHMILAQIDFPVMEGCDILKIIVILIKKSLDFTQHQNYLECPLVYYIESDVGCHLSGSFPSKQ